jgi:hypothetical protein
VCSAIGILAVVGDNLRRTRASSLAERLGGHSIGPRDAASEHCVRMLIRAESCNPGPVCVPLGNGNDLDNGFEFNSDMTFRASSSWPLAARNDG